MIEVKNLTKSYGDVHAVKDVSFTVEKGEVLGFLGPNGAGKSTTMNVITGYIPATGGTVKVAGFDIFDESKEVKKRIGYLPENPPLYADMTVWEYLVFVAQLKQVPSKQIKEQINDIIEKVKLEDVRHRLIKNISKGYKQRVGIAQAMIGSPEVLILDEPTVGLDPKQIIEVRNLIKSLGKTHTVILSSHILPEVSAICDKVVIINKGEIVAIDTIDNLSKHTASTSKITAQIEGDSQKALEIIQGIESVANVHLEQELDNAVCQYLIEYDTAIDIRRELFTVMAENKMPILETKAVDTSLEDIFLQLTTTDDDNVGTDDPVDPSPEIENDKNNVGTDDPVDPSPKIENDKNNVGTDDPVDPVDPLPEKAKEKTNKKDNKKEKKKGGKKS